MSSTSAQVAAPARWLPRWRSWAGERLKDPALRRLAEEYARRPIVLYTGAGVSAGPRERVGGIRYGLPTWLDLLRRVPDRPGVEPWPEDPWDAADHAVRLCGGEDVFQTRLRRLIEESPNYTRTYGQLAGAFLRHAPTLNAVAAFCGAVTARIDNPKRLHAPRVHFRTTANRRVRAVLTANYDCFLEAAGSNLYRKSPLRPVTALGSEAGSLRRIPVFHIHGYVHHPHHGRERKPAIEQLIMTRRAYERQWNTRDVFGTTMGPQIHYLRYFTVLFVGFSFTDDYVCRLLRRVNQDYLRHARRCHFALLSRHDLRRRGEPFFAALGVRPIAFDTFDEIPARLGAVHAAGLAADRLMEGAEPDRVSLPEVLVRRHTPTGRRHVFRTESLWPLMMALRNESAAAGLTASATEDVLERDAPSQN